VVTEGMKMYVPASFNTADEKTLESFIETYDFATVISSSSAGLIASHVPIVLRRSGEETVLVGHLARANEQWRHFDGNTECLVVFQGPHSYISPTWYATSPAVPTWNYSAVHVYGKPLATENTAFTTSAIEALVTKYEYTRPKPWETKDLAADLYSKLVAAIVAFEMPIDRMEGKFKLGQNRSREDRLGMLAGLDAESNPHADALAAFIRTHANA